LLKSSILKAYCCFQIFDFKEQYALKAALAVCAAWLRIGKWLVKTEGFKSIDRQCKNFLA